MSATDSARAPKRARVDSATVEPDGPSPLTFIRSDKVWMEDGNIILRVANDKVTTNLAILFKVHKFVLATHSTFFRDLFDGPQTAFEAASEKYEGLPVMEMQDDSEDLCDFLRALYYPSFTHRRHLMNKDELPRSAFPAMHAGVLRLASKYDAQDIREVVVEAFHEEWPSRLLLWDAREAPIREDVENGAWSQDVTIFFPDPAHTISLAMEFNIPSALPAAFYDLSRIYELDIDREASPRTCNLSRMIAAQLHHLIRGRAALRTYLIEDIAEPGRTWSAQCTRPREQSCEPYIERYWTEQIQAMHKSSDPLEWLRLAAMAEGLDICHKCRDGVKVTMEDERTTLWSTLPTIFDLKAFVADGWGD